MAEGFPSDPATKPKEQAKLIEQKGGEMSHASITKRAGLSKMSEVPDRASSRSSGYGSMDDELIEQKGGEMSYASITKRAGLSKKNELSDPKSNLRRLRRLRYIKISKTADQESSNYATTECEISKTADQESSDYATTECELKELEGVLLHTQRLIVHDLHSDTSFRLEREDEKSRQVTVLTGDAGLELHGVEWMSTDDETLLVLRDANFLRDVISILAPLCPTVKHISIDFHMIHPHSLLTHMPMPMPEPKPMRSVITVCFKSLFIDETLHDALLSASKLFPNAESLDVQMDDLHSPSDRAYFPEVNSSSSLRELKLRYEDMHSYDITTDSLLMDISTFCPNIVSLVFSGFREWLLNKSAKDITSCKMPHLTNIHLEPFGKHDCYRFETFMHVLHVFHVISPSLKFVEAKKVQLGDALLASVQWSHCDTSSDWELQFEGASAVVPLADLMHLVSNELKGVTVLRFDRCKVDFPQSISHPPHGTGEDSSLRELKFLNVEFPLSQSDTHKLLEMYPNVKVTVEHKSQASHEDSEQGMMIHFKPERKIFRPSSTPSIDELLGATARVQVHEEQTDTQNTEEEEKEEEGEDHIAMESLPYETVSDEVNVKPIKMECCKRVGVEGGKLQLESFGIELEIPPGAIGSEAPQDISLLVLTDTPNLGNSKEEMSVCFGVQCLAPDDLELKLPVTYTIPHCAVITRYSSVEAVLYTGEGEYSPDSVVKERIMLSRSGIPSCTIQKDVLKLKMNHFSWMMIKFLFRDFFYPEKRMCCRPFKEKNLALQKTPVILHAHLYDDIKGNSEISYCCSS